MASTDVLAELNDKCEVAALQTKIKTALGEAIAESSGRASAMSDALSTLDMQLMDASTLYSEYAERFGLYECQLSIVVCAAFNDQALVNELYVKIINQGG